MMKEISEETLTYMGKLDDFSRVIKPAEQGGGGGGGFFFLKNKAAFPQNY